MPSIKTPWTTSEIPDLSGKTVLVTGATGGLGFECSLQLALKGARVLVGGRNQEKGKKAVKNIKSACPKAKVSFVLIDHVSLESVSSFCKKFNARHEALDILINNAGLMAVPTRQSTEDFFELQFGTNHLSHFALTAQLLPSLRRSSSPRVVNVSSLAAQLGGINFKDLNWEQSYSAWEAYFQSKLSNILFTFELQKRSDANEWNILSLAAHPGIATTELVTNGPGNMTWTGWMLNKFVYPLFSQSQDKGALPILFAATSSEAQKYGYYGPNGFREMTGDVCEAYVPRIARDEESAKKLWKESEKLTGVKFE